MTYYESSSSYHHHFHLPQNDDESEAPKLTCLKLTKTLFFILLFSCLTLLHSSFSSADDDRLVVPFVFLAFTPEKNIISNALFYNACKPLDLPGKTHAKCKRNLDFFLSCFLCQTILHSNFAELTAEFFCMTVFSHIICLLVHK